MAAATSIREPHVGHYYPSDGRMPGYGRLEIEPPANRKLPKPAASYHQSWSAQSTPQPPDVPLYPPPVIVAPQIGDRLQNIFDASTKFHTKATPTRNRSHRRE